MNDKAAHIAQYQNKPSFMVAKIPYMPVWSVVLKALITFGIYIPYWFVSRSEQLNYFAGRKVVSKGWFQLILVLYVFTISFWIIGPFFLSDIILVLFEYVDAIITLLGVTATIFYSFQVRNAFLAENKGHRLNKVLLFFFHIFYLQYYVNKSLYTSNN